jgi:serine/threonine protein kinase
MICRHIAGQCQKVGPIHTRRVTPKFKLPASTRNNANFGAAEGYGQSTYRWGLGVALSSQISANGIDGLEILSEDGGLVFGRGWRDGAGGAREDVLIVFTASEQPAAPALDRITHEYSFKDELDSAWAVRPLELVRDRGRTILVLGDPGGELLNVDVGTPIEVERFLRIAIGVAVALGKVHQHGLIHKDIKPGNILVNTATGEVRLTGFGIASRLPRERQAPTPPEFIAGSLPYMAPEQTGRMNRSIDSRSDLYSLGVTFYHMLTGSLPFIASDPMEWVHCHIARTPISPGQRLETVPAPISGLVMKLLAKTPEERYQTAAGVEHDLRRTSRASSKRSTRPRPVAWGWGCRSAARSSKPMAAGCGQRRTNLTALMLPIAEKAVEKLKSSES